MRAVAPFGFRYAYLAGDVTAQNWATWDPNGTFATNFIQDSVNSNITPVFTYYVLRQSSPGAANGDDGQADATNLQSTSTMTAYYNNLRLLFQRSAAFPNTPVVIQFEPDLWGFLQRRATNDNAATVPAQVAATGMSELAGLPNNAAGFAQAAVRLRDRYAPNAILAYHLSWWGTGNDIVFSNPSNTEVDALATRSGNFFRSTGANFDMSFADWSDRDAGFKQAQYNDGGASWWDAGDFARNVRYLSRYVSVIQKRVAIWQIPYGNTRMRAMNNTWNHYQDNRVEWILDDPSRAHLTEYLQAGVIAFMFGGGAAGVTCPCDAARDGVTNPSPINGNNRVSINADDDGGFFKERAAAYYAAGAMPLPFVGAAPSPTGTPPPQATATPTRTPSPLTATPTRTPAASTATPTSGVIRVTFDDRAGQNTGLNGQYPNGVIDWGSGRWYHSGPWLQFTTKSLSFRNATINSASFTLPTPRRLVSLRAFNGGTAAATVTLSCQGQPTTQVTLAASQVVTIATSWTDVCSSITIATTNNWMTNFDDLVLYPS